MIISECLIIKDENRYLIEHLIRGIEAGIDKFFIYDNGSKTPVREYLNNRRDLLDRCSIENFQAEKAIQESCYQHYLSSHREDSDWTIFIDTDELLTGDLRKLCGNTKLSRLYFRGITYKSNGLLRYEDKPMADRFSDIEKLICMRKSCVRNDKVKYQKPHESILHEEERKFYPSDVSLHHYFFKSFEEYIWKIERGVIQDQTVRRLSEFFKFNKYDFDQTEVKRILDENGYSDIKDVFTKK